MPFDMLRSPIGFLKEALGELPHAQELRNYELWWRQEGMAISEAIDRARTPWLRMFDRSGERRDEILYSPDYRRMLKQGYAAGVVWLAFEEKSLLPSYALLYLTSFFDPGVACPYIVSLATAVSVQKYAEPAIRERFLPPLLRRDDMPWQGATWMTEIKGGSDLGAAVETTAVTRGDVWLLTGDKYFASNAGAELSVVAARPEGAPGDVRGLALFLLPRFRGNGELNYFLRRLKDKIATRSVPTGEVELRSSEAYLLGSPGQGIYLILEVLNLSRVANSVACVALAQRAMGDALTFAERRAAFGRAILEHPLLRRQFEDRLRSLRACAALASEAVRLLNEVWQERPPYSERYHVFRLVAHLAKYWTAEFAAQTAKWAMEVHGGLGVLEECGVERWLRGAMILAIWEGTSHRQVLDALEVIERKRAHLALFRQLAPRADPAELQAMERRVEGHVALPAAEREARAEALIGDLASFTAGVLAKHGPNP